MRIGHVALYCKDLERMRKFFGDYFNALSNDMYHNPRTGLRTYFLSFAGGGAGLELMCRPGTVGGELELMCRPGTVGGDPSAVRVGFTHVSFAVGSRDAVDALTARLAADGYAVADGPRITGDGYYESCVAGPEGILIEITV